MLDGGTVGTTPTLSADSDERLLKQDSIISAACRESEKEREIRERERERERERMGGEDGRDARKWDEEGYRRSVLREREIQSRTVFRTVFAPSQNPNPDVLVVASSDGSLAPYSISSCISSQSTRFNRSRYQQWRPPLNFFVAEPLCFLQGHDGPAYDIKFYGDGEDCLLLSCGDDGRIRGWKWEEVLNSDVPVSMQGNHLNPVLDLVNPQHEGPWGALSPIPENNAIAIDSQTGSIFSATGDSYAYCWDAETCKVKMVFRGHSDYLHCIAACKSSNRIITGSEDGTARIWDCKSGKCIRAINPKDNFKLKETSSWVSCISIDTSESWLACGSGRNLSVWSLPSCECILRFDTRSPTQDVVFQDNQDTLCWSRTYAHTFQHQWDDSLADTMRTSIVFFSLPTSVGCDCSWRIWRTCGCDIRIWKPRMHVSLQRFMSRIR